MHYHDISIVINIILPKNKLKYNEFKVNYNVIIIMSVKCINFKFYVFYIMHQFGLNSNFIPEDQHLGCQCTATTPAESGRHIHGWGGRGKHP